MLPVPSLEPYWPLYLGLSILFCLGGAIVAILTSNPSIQAPYGRFDGGFGSRWSATMPQKWAWILMELPPFLIVNFLYIGIGLESHKWNPRLQLAFLCYAVHYFNRSFVYPFSLTGGKGFSVLVAVLGFIYNILNSTIQGLWLGHFAPLSDDSGALGTARLALGLAIFFFGFLVNRHADLLLSRLRKPGETDYKIPHGGIFNYTSAGNYTAELIEWIGYALVLNGLAGWVFVFMTFCTHSLARAGLNPQSYFAPRASRYHDWYKAKFPTYPQHRRRLIPFVW